MGEDHNLVVNTKGYRLDPQCVLELCLIYFIDLRREVVVGLDVVVVHYSVQVADWESLLT